MMKKLCLLSIVVLVAGCEKPAPPKDAVAVVGDRVIDVRELNRSYVLRPQWKRGQSEMQSYLMQLEALETQKLYAQEAEKLGLDRDSLMQGYLEFLKQKEMIRGLYRKEVKEKVRIAEPDERRMYEWMKKTVDYAYVFSPDSAQCASYAKLLEFAKGDSITIAPGSPVKAGKKTEGKIGTVPHECEQFLFTGRLHDVSPPIRSEGGFVTVKITGGTQDKFLAENDFASQKESIDKLLTERQSDAIASHYVATLMRDKDLKLDAKVFWQVAEYFWRRVREEHVDPMKMQNVYVTGDEIQLLSVDLNTIGDAVVATHRDGTLTVKDLLRALANMPGSLRPRVRTPQNLKDAIGGIVRNQYLLKEAARQGMASDPEVQYEYGLQRDETLANAYYDRRRSGVAVSPEEVEVYKRKAPVSEEQVFFKLNMTSLARDAKIDSILRSELPGLRSQYRTTLDTAKVRSLLKTPDAIIQENPMPIYIREVFM
ncbi:MAG: hypothetical protein WB699_12195 [Bacteroidota bacterium]